MNKAYKYTKVVIYNGTPHVWNIMLKTYVSISPKMADRRIDYVLAYIDTTLARSELDYDKSKSAVLKYKERIEDFREKKRLFELHNNEWYIATKGLSLN